MENKYPFHALFQLTHTDMILKYISLLFFGLFINNANAGGMIFPIEINKIDSISHKEHQIHFKLLAKVGSEYYAYPLDNCKTVTLNIVFKEWELKHKIFLFFDNLFNPMINTKYLNQQIVKLKKYINKPIIMSDVEAFYHSPTNDCELFSKTFQLTRTAHPNGKDYTVLMLPIRHHSRLENKPK